MQLQRLRPFFMQKSKIVTDLEQQTKTKYKQSKDTPFDISKTVLYDYDGDLSKRWIIIYHIYNSDSNKLERKQIKISQKLQTEKDRRQYARQKISDINKVLKAGFYIGSVQLGEVAKITIKSVWEIYELNHNQYKARTKDSYKTGIVHFENYLNKKGLLNIKLLDFEKNHALGFRDYLSNLKNKGGQNISNRTTNGYWSTISTFFEYMKNERDWIKVNPFASIKKLKQIETITNRAWKSDEIEILMPILQKQENQTLFLFSQFIYWLWLRPADIVNLKVIDFDLHRFKVLVPASITKNSKTKWITIPENFRPLLLATGIKEQRHDKYIFAIDENRKGKKATLFGFEPCADNLFSKYFAAIREGTQVSKEVKLYGLKRNGFCNAAENGASIYTLKDHARHSTLDETDTYLRNSGINLIEEQEINKMKNLY